MEREYSSEFKFGDTEYLWPTGLTEILYVNGPSFKLINAYSETNLPNEMIIGAYNRRFVLRNNGNIRIVGIRCYNHGANILFGIDLNKIKNNIIEYKLNHPKKDILNLKNKEEIVLYLNDYCKTLVEENKFSDVLYRLYTEESFSIEQLRRESNLSLRQFERKVKIMTSFNPKELTTIIRFDKARFKMLFNKDYIDVMNDLGYYDYSHFSKDFKKFYDITPKQFIELYSKTFK